MNNNYLLQGAITTLLLLGGGFSTSAQVTNFTVPGSHIFTVPGNGVNGLLIDMQGATGGANDGSISAGGAGGRVQCILAVQAGQVYQVNVGGVGGVPPTAALGGTGGINGGGDGQAAASPYAGGGGGGASDIRLAPYYLSNRLVIAAGGGGAGHDCTAGQDAGGSGGGPNGGMGYRCNVQDAKTGQGATQSAGGAGGVYSSWNSGTAGTDSLGGTAGLQTGGGGGGGGYFCGGGGSWGGGGGGSSYAIGTLATGVVNTAAYNTSGNGSVSLTLQCETPVAGTIAGGNTLCSGGNNVTLTNATGSNYGHWFSSNTAVATIDSITGMLTSGVAGSTTISYTIFTACGTTATATLAFTVTASPVSGTITGVDHVCAGHTVTLANTALGGLWSSSNTAVATANSTTGEITGVQTGSTTISYTVTNGGCSSAATLPFNVLTTQACNTGIGNVDGNGSVTVVPNPSKGTFTITIAANNSAEVKVVVTNLLGETLQEMTVATNIPTIMETNMPAGIYFITAYNSSSRWTEKIVITR